MIDTILNFSYIFFSWKGFIVGQGNRAGLSRFKPLDHPLMGPGFSGTVRRSLRKGTIELEPKEG